MIYACKAVTLAKKTIDYNYLINIIHQQEARAIPPSRASGTAAEKRDSAILSERDWVDK